MRIPIEDIHKLWEASKGQSWVPPDPGNGMVYALIETGFVRRSTEVVGIRPIGKTPVQLNHLHWTYAAHNYFLAIEKLNERDKAA